MVLTTSEAVGAPVKAHALDEVLAIKLDVTLYATHISDLSASPSRCFLVEVLTVTFCMHGSVVTLLQGALLQYMQQNVPSFCRDCNKLDVFQFSHGQSNPTYLLKVTHSLEQPSVSTKSLRMCVAGAATGWWCAVRFAQEAPGSGPGFCPRC